MGKLLDLVESMQVDDFYGLPKFQQSILNKKIKLAVKRMIKEDLGYSLDVEVHGQAITKIAIPDEYRVGYEGSDPPYYIVYYDDTNVTQEADFLFIEFKKLIDKIRLLEISLKSFEKNNTRRM